MKKLLFIITLMLSITALSACQIVEVEQSQQSRFESVLAHLRDNHYKQLDESELWDGAIQGLFDALDDPYSRYFSKEEYQRYRDSLGESFVGVGITIENIDNLPVVRKVWESSPAENAGMRPGDTITHVDGDDMTDEGYFAIIGVVQGEKGTDVELGVRRPGVSETIFMTMTREEIPNPTVVSDVFDIDGLAVGYIKVNSFGVETYDIFTETLNAMENEHNIDGLIIDLRDNGGGQLTTVLNMMNLFLVEKDLPMFSTEHYINGEFSRTEYHANNDYKKSYDILTIINEYSASASEVFAAAMKQHGGYDVLGMPTLGKGTMQTASSPNAIGEDELHVSTGIWLTPNDVWVNAVGGDQPSVFPTIPVDRDAYFDAYNIFLGESQELTLDTVDEQNRQAQLILNALGYGEIRTDSYFDQATKAAVEAFQQDHGLSVTGIIDNLTARALSDGLVSYRQDLQNDNKLTAAKAYFQ